MNICIIGSSKRAEILENNLKKLGYDLQSYKTTDELPPEIIADYVVLPIPTLLRNGNINLPGSTDGLSPDGLFSRFRRDTVFISCNYENNEYRIVDINKREDFAYLNAVPTAEGAIHAAIDTCGYSLFTGRILITGFGRVGKILADRLKGLSCHVTIAARSLKDLSYAKALGLSTTDIRELTSSINNYDLVFQTVPTTVLNDKVIEQMKPDCIVVELSSRSAGTDCDSAEKHGINVVHAQALPEKVAPITAGNILTESVLSIIAESTTNG